MTSNWTLLRDLFWPVDATATTPPRPPLAAASVQAVQTERALRLVRAAMIGGAVAIAALALGQPRGGELALLTVGLLAALAAGVVGGTLGLLFGMPASVSRVTVVAAAPAADASHAVATRPAENDWYRDNDALESISKWLTTAIVALSIANYNSFANHFDTLAAAVTAAMLGRTNGGMVAGGTVLAAYAVLGFLAGYLWTRRYLPAEFSSAVADQRHIQQQSLAEMAGGADNVAARRSAADERGAAAAAAAAAAGPSPPPTGSGAETISRERPRFAAVVPGPRADDPWNGAFGGAFINGRVEMGAAVTALGDAPGLYRIDLHISGVDLAARSALAGKALQLYLHPTFPNPVRIEEFDALGRFLLTLVAYGAFTIGVQIEGGQKLELDLAKLSNAPATFRLG